MSLPRVHEIEAMFALAADWELPTTWPVYATPKLNGLRAMWVPGLGLVSKDGVPYADGILPHIESDLKHITMWLDGELYASNLSLQTINSRAGVVREKAHEHYNTVQYHVFDAPQCPLSFVERQDMIRAHITDHRESIKLVPYKVCNCKDHFEAAHSAYVSMGCEGTVYKSAGHYQPGRSRMMLKRKAYFDEDFEVVELLRGEKGKYDHSMGAVICKTKDGKIFKVGSFKMTDEDRLDAWCGPVPKIAKVKYFNISDTGVPCHTQIIGLS